MKGNTNTTDLRVAEIKDSLYANITTQNTHIVNENISSYTTRENSYIAPRDGYVVAESATSSGGAVKLYDNSINLYVPYQHWATIFVKKGTKIFCESGISRAFFRAYW